MRIPTVFRVLRAVRIIIIIIATGNNILDKCALPLRPTVVIVINRRRDDLTLYLLQLFAAHCHC